MLSLANWLPAKASYLLYRNDSGSRKMSHGAVEKSALFIRQIGKGMNIHPAEFTVCIDTVFLSDCSDHFIFVSSVTTGTFTP